ncbi:alpha-ketoglutarate-dependent dioxygenase AlkB [Sphingomonas floccifaciens]|uniref:Alpha-ketoglutarate-dependent dioxygenase AlkB n=1 Tax=Sphingomonas floccifaciens TaxID=1844115 RepID=A0ABW4NCM2_9SPHN
MATLFTDLFDTPVIPGLSSGEDIVDREEEADLIARIDAEALSPFRFQGWLGKRVTRSFGWHYDFDGGALAEGEPLPKWLLPLRRRAASFADLGEDTLEQALLIRYDPGAGIGWHRDRPVFGHVVGISLGAEATMRFRRRRPDGFLRTSAPLAQRSIYHMAGEVRHEWEHSIAEMDETRWSVTFRSLANGAVPDGR